ncbi:MAG: nucleoside-diphosphate sugar epimerase/dehydratase, partial [Rubricoccaceae bacterium]
LLVRRVVQRRRARGPRRTLLVGSAAEARRLRRLLGRPMESPAVLAGYVGEARTGGRGKAAVPYLGPTRQLRDVVRLHGITEVVFASDSVTNTTILEGMRSLHDLPVQVKILASGHDRIIGKASVEDFSRPVVAAERIVSPVRSAAQRRLVEVPVALAGMALHPVLRALARLYPTPRLRRLAAFSARMPSVLARRRALVGYDPRGAHPPAAWGLAPGVVSILDTLPERPVTITAAHRAYWFYARYQSAGLDLEILLRALFRS